MQRELFRWSFNHYKALLCPTTDRRLLSCSFEGGNNVHLSNRARDLRPHAINLVVQPLKGKCLQRWIRL